MSEHGGEKDAGCPECGDHRGWWVGPDWNTGDAVQVQCRTCAEHECPIPPGSTHPGPEDTSSERGAS